MVALSGVTVKSTKYTNTIQNFQTMYVSSVDPENSLVCQQ